MINFCCGHSGLYRLLLPRTGAVAEQTITRLEPGRYTLWGWVTTRDAVGEIRVAAAGGEAVQSRVDGEAWQRVTLDFEVPPGGGGATISIGGQFGAGAGALLAVDDLYLFRR